MATNDWRGQRVTLGALAVTTLVTHAIYPGRVARVKFPVTVGWGPLVVTIFFGASRWLGVSLTRWRDRSIGVVVAAVRVVAIPLLCWPGLPGEPVWTLAWLIPFGVSDGYCLARAAGPVRACTSAAWLVYGTSRFVAGLIAMFV